MNSHLLKNGLDGLIDFLTFHDENRSCRHVDSADCKKKSDPKQGWRDCPIIERRNNQGFTNSMRKAIKLDLKRFLIRIKIFHSNGMEDSING